MNPEETSKKTFKRRMQKRDRTNAKESPWEKSNDGERKSVRAIASQPCIDDLSVMVPRVE
jgi:hypothetical protein